MNKNFTSILILFIFLLFSCTQEIETGDNSTQDSQANKDLYFYYNFDEQSGNSVIDNSGNNRNGTIYSASRVTTGKQGTGYNSVKFDYSSAYIQVPVIPNTGIFSIQAWINLSELNSSSTYSIMNSYNNHDWALQIINNKLAILYQGTLYFSSSQELITDTWIYVTFTSDGTNINFYIDGILDNSLNITFPAGFQYTYQIGLTQTSSNGLSFSYSNQLKGTIDELKIWNKALTQTEILDYYNSSK